jgi:dihydrofolate synthase/folylpolyglutamate synthase
MATRLAGVVGSKGKGTAVLYAAATLAAAGLRVGTITGPGLRSSRDRIRIDGTALAPEDYRALSRLAASAIEALPPQSRRPADYVSPSGLYVLAGVRFLTDRCDVIVAEAGIGGASDELSLLPLGHLAVTSVFAEHGALLGSTVPEIAAEKLGAAGPCTRRILYLANHDAGSRSALRVAADRRAADLGIPAVPVRSSAQASSLGIPMPYGFGAGNAALGIALGQTMAEGLGIPPPSSCALGGVLATVRHPGRCTAHRMGEAGGVVVDAAVSGEGLSSALAYAREAFGGEPDRILVCLPQDKDLAGFSRQLAPVRERVVWMTLPASHLVCGPRPAWAGSEAALDGLRGLLTSGNVLVVGTALFVGDVLGALGVSTETLFTPPSRVSPSIRR